MAPETDDRKQDGSQLDIEALLRQAMGGGAGDGRFGIKTGSAAPNALPARTDSSFSVPAAGNTPQVDDDRPTLGQRIAGDAPKPQPAPTQVAEAAPPAFNLDPGKMPDALRAASVTNTAGLPTAITPSQVPRPPTGSNNQRRLDLMKRQEQLDVPTDPSAVDPKTGKPMYKMGVGGRILGTVANFASGFGGRGGDPVYVGPGATNWKFGRAEDLRNKNLAGVKSELGNEEKLDTSEETKYRDALKQAYEGQIGDARERLAASGEKNAATRAELESSQAEKNAAQAELARTKAGQEPEPKTEAEIALALQTAQLKGDKQGVLKYKGALAELAKQKAAGKDTSAADVQKAILAAEFRSREHDKVNTDYEKERRDRTEEFAKTPAGRIDYYGKKLAAFSASLKQELDAKYAARHQDIDSQADKMLGLTKAGASLKTGATLSPLKPTQPAPAGRVWVFDLKTGRRGTIPLSQLKSATSGPNPQYGTW